MKETDNGKWPAAAGDPRSLPIEIEPPAQLEDRVVKTLVERGLLRPDRGASRRAPGWRTLRAALAAAACIALVTIGFLAGRSTVAPLPPSLTGAETDLYALLLFETEKYDAPSGPEAATRYGEYSEWVAYASARRQFVTGEDLEVQRGWLLTPADDGVAVSDAAAVEGAAPLSGVFFVRADNPEEALEVAKQLPHLRHGGQVVVQKTLRTDIPPPAEPAAADQPDS